MDHSGVIGESKPTQVELQISSLGTGQPGAKVADSSAVNSTQTHHAHAHVSTRDQKRRQLLFTLWKVLLLLMVIAVIVFCVTQQDEFVSRLLSLSLWVKQNKVAAPFAVIGIGVILFIVCFPVVVWLVCIAFIFVRVYDFVPGIAVAVVCQFTSLFIGGHVSFLIARFIARGVVSHILLKYRVLRALDKAIEMKGALVLFVIRLAIFLPAPVFNYGSGLTAAKIYQYSIGCCGALPGQILVAYLGGTLSSLTSAISGGNVSLGPGQTIAYIVGGIISLVVVTYTGCIARKFLKQMDAELERSGQVHNVSIADAIQGVDHEEDDEESNTENSRNTSPSNANSVEATATALGVVGASSTYTPPVSVSVESASQ